MDFESVGTSSAARWVAYGDDSVYSGTISYAFVMFKRSKLSSISRELADLKRRFGFPDGVKLHCRELLSGQLRSKHGLSHLTLKDINKILKTVVAIINKHGGLFRFSFAFQDKIEHAFAGPLEFTSISDDVPNTHLNSTYSDKGVLGLLAQMCFANPPGGMHGPRPYDCQIFISPDKTMVGFIGDKKSQAHYLSSGFQDDLYGEGRGVNIKPVIGGDYFPEIYEIADVASYICCHSIHGLHGRSDEQRYIEFYNHMRWRVGFEFVTE